MSHLENLTLRGGRSRKRNLFSHVVEELGSRIVRGDFAANAALPNEAELGQEFGASRSVIREAVKSLAAKGLLESRTRTGIRVLAPIHWNLLDPEVLAWRYSSMRPAEFFREIFEVRGLIEPEAAALAAERATDAEVAEIAQAFSEMEAVDQPGASAIDADLRFHHAVLAGAHNDLLLQMGNLIGVGLLVSYRLSSDSYTVFLPFHARIAHAIVARDPTGARAAMANLLTETRKYLDARLASRSTVRTKKAKARAKAAVPG
jgi:DNA-binding FadR family transcriptional regulator